MLNPAYGAQTFGYVYRPPWAGLSQALEMMRPASQPDDAVLFHIVQLDQEPFMKFPLEHIMYGIDGRYDQAGMIRDSFTRSDNLYIQEVLTFLDDAPLVWQLTIPEVPTTNLTDVTRYVLETRYRLCDVRLQDEHIDFRLHANALTLPPVWGTFVQADGATIDLHNIGRIWQSEGAYNVLLGYYLDGAIMDGRYSGGVHILDEAGALVAQADFGLPDDVRPYGCRWARLDIASLGAGTYTVNAIIYDWQTGERLQVGERDGVTIDRLVIQERTQ